MSINKNPLVRLSGDKLITTSLAISQHFGKKHPHVLEAIRNLDCSEEFNRSNFRSIYYNDGRQRKKPMYEITRDGFVYLCMGFTGSQAAKWKEAYISAFNQLEAKVTGTEHQQELTGLAIPTFIRKQLLKNNPAWTQIQRYKLAGLMNTEIAKLLECSTDTVRRHIRDMERCGLLEPHPQLVTKQQHAQRFLTPEVNHAD